MLIINLIIIALLIYFGSKMGENSWKYEHNHGHSNYVAMEYAGLMLVFHITMALLVIIFMVDYNFYDLAISKLVFIWLTN